MRHDKTPGVPVATFRKASLATCASLGMLVPVIGILATAFRWGRVASGIFLAALIMTPLAYALWLLASSAVRIGKDGVIVDNLLMRHIIPWHNVIDIAVDNGLVIRVFNGPNVGSIMYGGSVLGALSGYTLTERACARMNAKRKEILSSGIPPEGNKPYRRIIHFSPWPPLIILAVLEGLASVAFIR
jgi:hypothetical protein